MKRLLFLVGVFCLTLALAPQALANAADEVNQALDVSKKWIAQIDSGHYDDSYAFGCSDFQEKVPADRWATILKALRAPWGPVTNRTQVSHIYKPDGMEGSIGEFMVITYDTSFQKKPDVKEVVVLKWENGKWRGAGYNAGSKPSADSATAQTTSSSTQINTQEHVRPPAN